MFVQMWIGAEDKLPRMLRAVWNDPAQLRHQMECRTGGSIPVPADAFASGKAEGDAHSVRAPGPEVAAGVGAADAGQGTHPKPTVRKGNHDETITIGFVGLLITALSFGPAAAWSPVPGWLDSGLRREGGSWSGEGARGGTASGGEGSWSGNGACGGACSGGDGSWNATGAYGGPRRRRRALERH